MSTTEDKILIIGAGPTGLAIAKALQESEIAYDIYDRSMDVGGIWNIDTPDSPIYESAHMVSSKDKTAFSFHPMPDEYPDYPSHTQVYRYLQDIAETYNVYPHILFNKEVIRAVPQRGLWLIEDHTGTVATYGGLIIATGPYTRPHIPDIAGSYTGRLIHSQSYKSADLLADKRVLIIGNGNSACDIAVDAVHRAQSVDMSIRSGHYILPKYLLEKPTDQVLYDRGDIANRIEKELVQRFLSDMDTIDWPQPKHEIFDRYPVINSHIIDHLKSGDIAVRSAIAHVEEDTVRYTDGTEADYDIIIAATGYEISFPFIHHRHLNWSQGTRPELYLNTFTPWHRNLFVAGMMDAYDLGWDSRYQQGQLIAKVILGTRADTSDSYRFWERTVSDRTRIATADAMESPSKGMLINPLTFEKEIQKLLAINI